MSCGTHASRTSTRTMTKKCVACVACVACGGAGSSAAGAGAGAGLAAHACGVCGVCGVGQVIHNDFLRSCRKQCDDDIKAFVECSKREGLLVVFRCRGENAAMSECLRPLTTPEKYEEYKAKHGITMGDKPASAPAPGPVTASSRTHLP